MENINKKRYLEEKIFKVLMYIALGIVGCALLTIVGIIVIKGGKALIANPKVIISLPGSRYLLGGEGGFLHAILGSFYMVIPATVIASLLAIGIALFLQSDYSSKKFSEVVRLFLDALWGVPSIVYGVFVLTILIYLHQRACLLAGIFTLTLLELPIIARYADEAIQSLRVGTKEIAYSMGATRWEAAKVTLKCALPGITAGILIGMGRAAGDAASVIFTSGAASTAPNSLFEMATALPVMIFQQANSCYATVRGQAYAAALVLILIVLVLNIASRLISKRLSTYIPRDI